MEKISMEIDLTDDMERIEKIIAPFDMHFVRFDDYEGMPMHDTIWGVFSYRGREGSIKLSLRNDILNDDIAPLMRKINDFIWFRLNPDSYAIHIGAKTTS